VKKPYINNQIRAKEVRLIDEAEKQLGVLSLEESLRIAREKGLDLIQVTEKVEPPVCRIMDFGKYLYRQQKKEKGAKHHHGGEVKGIRLTFRISDHDMEIRARQAEKFLKEGDSVKIDLVLRGREKALQNFARQKLDKFMEILKKLVPIKQESQMKKGPGCLTIIVSYDKHQDIEHDTN
jgi:translation initiation factor IF-3